MPLTLVSHYGEKPAGFNELMGELQRLLTGLLGSEFCPYEKEQVHGTIVGLEGIRVGPRLLNRNFYEQRRQESPMDLEGLLNFLRSPAWAEFELQLGGFGSGRDFGFTSQGEHPFARSFSIRNGSAVIIGWPLEHGRSSPVLDAWRRQFQRFGVLHKWHRHDGDVDNDFFCVLGRVTPSPSTGHWAGIEQKVREHLAARPPLRLAITRETLAFVAYQERELPPKTSRVFKLNDATTTAETLARAGRDL